MPEFMAIHPDVQVLGRSLMGVLQAMGEAGLPEAWVAQTASRQGLEDLLPEAWYPQQAYLDLLHAVHDAFGEGALHTLGHAVPRTSRFPPDIRTLARALRTLDVAYHLNHRGGAIGGYLFESLGEGMARLHCDTPYGCAFDTGILEGLITCFHPTERTAKLLHLPVPPCRRLGGSTCVYQIAWQPETPHP